MNILLVEDNPGDARLIKEMLKEDNAAEITLQHVERLSAALVVLEKEEVDVILLDLGLPDSQGIETVESIAALNLIIPIVVLTGLDDDEQGLKAVQQGAQDYLIKNKITAAALRRVTAYAFERKKIEKTLQRKNKELSALFAISNAISQTFDMQDILTEIVSAIRKLALQAISDEVVIFTSKKDFLYKVFDTRPAQSIPEGCDRIRLHQCLCGKAFASGETIISLNQADDDRHDLVCSRMALHGHVILPLKSKSKTIGVLCLYTLADTAIAEGDLSLLGTIANQIGMAIDNSRLYEKTKHLAFHDALTGLGNRRLIDIFFAKLIAKANRAETPFALIMADIDFFKKYNDTYGHAEGDILLAKVSAIFLAMTRAEDLLGRYGGEEFLLLLPGEDKKTAVEIAERIRKEVEEKTPVTISLGVTDYSADQTQEDLIRLADGALYLAKNEGRNRVVAAAPELN